MTSPRPWQDRPVPQPRGPLRHLVVVDEGSDDVVIRCGLRSGIAVIAICGTITPAVLGRCRAAADQVVRSRPDATIIDLGGARSQGQAWLVVDAIRRHLLRHGVPLWIAAVPPRVAEELIGTQTVHGVRLAATVEVAVADAVREHRSYRSRRTLA